MEMCRGVFLALSSIFVGISLFFLCCFIFLPFSLCLTCFFHFVHLFQINRISHCWVSLYGPKEKAEICSRVFLGWKEQC
uniref:Putative ovule protein n=1 Tax=Solanum chacoense TaxID=4108 RepID=A0A0V0HIW1_SOLCH